VIRAGDRVAAVLAKDERLLEVFTSASPAFEMLRNAAARRTMARLVTIEQAARIAGIDAATLVARLNVALGVDPSEAAAASSSEGADASAAARAEGAPAGLLETPAERIVDLDVRDDLRAGREPFRKIFDAARALPPGHVLRLRAIFEPAPLYAVLGKQALGHYTERLAADDWRVWFFHDRAAAEAGPAAAAPPSDDDVVVLDVRGLEPPEPMERTLEALAALPRGKTLVQLNVRVPQFLLPRLAERGFTYEVREQSPELVRLFIRHA
jgi:uncharacterized protein (DUF2249 family)